MVFDSVTYMVQISLQNSGGKVVFLGGGAFFVILHRVKKMSSLSIIQIRNLKLQAPLYLFCFVGICFTTSNEYLAHFFMTIGTCSKQWGSSVLIKVEYFMLKTNINCAILHRVKCHKSAGFFDTIEIWRK